MKTSPLPHNYNKKSFVFAALIYLMVLVSAHIFISKPKAQQLNLGSQSVVLNFTDIKMPTADITKTKTQENQKQTGIKAQAPKSIQPKTEKQTIKKRAIKKDTINKEPKKLTKKEQPKKEQPKKDKHAKVKNAKTQNKANNAQALVNNKAPEKTSKSQHLVFGKDHNPILLAIKHAIDKNLAYPRKARLMKQQGIAVVSFKYKHKKLISKKLIKSSGFKLLDKAALDTIDKASISFPVSSDLLTITIPIEFKLR